MSFYRLYQEIISNHLCVDCGACKLICPANVIDYERDLTSYEPHLTGKCLGDSCGKCVDVCPGANVPLKEIEGTLMGRSREEGTVEDTLGILKRVYVAQWDDDTILEATGSGGVVTGLLVHAMEKGLIDAAVVTGPDPDKPWLSQAVLATSPEEITRHGGSRYDSFPQLSALQEAVDQGFSKLGFVALPCHAHALRKLQLDKQYAKFAKRIQFILGLWCVGNFTKNGIEYLVNKRFGFSLDEVDTLNYRSRPFPGQLTITSKSGETKSELWVSRYTLHLLARSFYMEACRFCTDGFAEFADISFGDPWGYKTDKIALETGIGYSCALIRTSEGQQLMDDARQAGKFRHLEELSGSERDFIAGTTPGLKVYSHNCFNDERARHGIPIRRKQ